MDQQCLPLGYLFLGKEPYPLLACDLSTCQVNDDYNHAVVCLTCGQSGERNYAMDHTVKCPVCYEPLQHHMQQLATTLNRLDFNLLTC